MIIIHIFGKLCFIWHKVLRGVISTRKPPSLNRISVALHSWPPIGGTKQSLLRIDFPQIALFSSCLGRTPEEVVEFVKDLFGRLQVVAICWINFDTNVAVLEVWYTHWPIQCLQGDLLVENVPGRIGDRSFQSNSFVVKQIRSRQLEMPTSQAASSQSSIILVSLLLHRQLRRFVP